MGSLRQTAARAVRSVFRRFGFDLVRRDQLPRHTLLGLRRLDVRTIIDVGANAGQFARSIQSEFPAARILSFEPQREPFRRLEDWGGEPGAGAGDGVQYRPR